MTVYRTLLVPVDGSAASNRGLREALRLARAQSARIVLLHVVDELYVIASPEMGAYTADVADVLRKEGRKRLERWKAQVEKAGVRVQAQLREIMGGGAATEILRVARKLKPDLIVMGTHGRRGLRRLALGSDAEQVVREANCPVLLVRGPK